VGGERRGGGEGGGEVKGQDKQDNKIGINEGVMVSSTAGFFAWVKRIS
jgi:hypothetical protein